MLLVVFEGFGPPLGLHSAKPQQSIGLAFPVVVSAARGYKLSSPSETNVSLILGEFGDGLLEKF